MIGHASTMGTRPGLRSGRPSAQAAPLATCDTRGVRASALKIGVAGMSVAEIVKAFKLDATNHTHARKVQRWLDAGAPVDAIAALPAHVQARYHAALFGAQEAA